VAVSLTVVLLVTPPAGPTGAADYVVDPGDTLSGIADELGVRLTDLLRTNHITVTAVIHPGQRLTVPGTGGGAPSAAGGRTYTVRAGDSLFGIAYRHDVSLASLLRANRITATDTIYPGDRLRIPGAGGAPPPTGRPSTGNYTVRSGDSLFGIANRHGISLTALLRANRITATDTIYPGDRLRIPGGSAPGPQTPPSPSPGGRTYTVRSGDSLSAIADRHGASLAALVAANDMAVTDLILPGMRLTLPAGARAGGGGGGGGGGATGSPLDRVVGYALAQVGKPWRFFTRGPNAFDCSGLALAAYSRAGIRLVHHSASQANQGVAVDFPNEPIRRGDLVFTNTDGGNVVNHVGIALDSNTWVQARAPGFGVQVTPIPSARVILAVRRFLPGG
jgi:peptidoglycan DL-endopeptidase LytE